MRSHRKRRPTRPLAKFIARFEGFRPYPYLDAVGVWTIGFGHTGPDVGPHSRLITRAEGLRILARDMQGAADAVNELVKVKLNRNEFGALVSFVFNCGAGAFEDSTLLRELNRGHREKVPQQLMRWVNGGGQVLPGLVTRRRAEGRLFTAKVKTPGRKRTR